MSNKKIEAAIKGLNNNELKNLLNDDKTRQSFGIEHVDQIIELENDELLNTVLGHKSLCSLINSNHISKAIENGKIEIFKSLLRESNVKAFNRSHIDNAINHNQTSILNFLLTRNTTKKLANTTHAQTVIDEYSAESEEENTLSVFLDKKPKLFSLKYQDEEQKTDCIGSAIKQGKNDAFKVILKKIPKSVTEKHLSSAIELRSLTLVNLIVEKKSKLLTKEHVLLAAETGDVHIIGEVFTEAFKRENRKKNSPSINTPEIRDKAFFKLAEYARNNSKDENQIDTNLFKEMLKLMDIAANSKTRLKNIDGITTSAFKILKDIKGGNQSISNNEDFKLLLKRATEQKDRHPLEKIQTKGKEFVKTAKNMLTFVKIDPLKERFRG